MSKKAWIIFIVLCVGLLGGLVYMSRDKAPAIEDSVNLDAFVAASEQTGNIADHTLGNKDAKVVVIEYGDYQCPGCADVSPELEKAVKLHPDDVLFIFRNYPLPSLHPNARAAAAAAEAAGIQDKFWEMHDLLYTNQDSWKNLSGTERADTFKAYAEQLGLNIDTFTADMSSDAIAKKIDYDQALGNKKGVNGSTPTVYVNGQKTTTGLTSSDTFNKDVLVPAIEAANKQ